MSEANIGDGRFDAGRPQSDPYGAGQSATPPPPPSIPLASPSAGLPPEETIAPADAVYTGNPTGLPAPQIPLQNAPTGYPTSGYPAGGYPGAPQTPQGYPGQQVAGYPAPGQPGAYAPQGYPAPGYPAAGSPTPGYPVPGYSAPGYPAPGQPYAAYGAYAAIPPSGRRYWALQFLFCVPFFGMIAAVIIALVQRSSARHSPLPLIRENARWAANWALSFVLYVIVSYAVVIIVAITLSGARNDQLGALAVIPVVLIYGFGIYCLVTIIIGTVKADRFVHRPFLALPFFRN